MAASLPMQAHCSSGQYLGSEDGDGDDNTDPPDGADWTATYRFTVNGGTYKILARIITSPGNSFWFRISDADTSPQLTRTDGWINSNMDNGDAWHWDEINDDDNVVEFTLSAGEHILEIAKREDGAQLDVIVITN